MNTRDRNNLYDEHDYYNPESSNFDASDNMSISDNSAIERAFHNAKLQQEQVSKNMQKFNVNNPSYKIGSTAFNQTFGGSKTGGFPSQQFPQKSKDPYAIDLNYNTNYNTTKQNKDSKSKYGDIAIDYNKIQPQASSTAGFGQMKQNKEEIKKKRNIEDDIDDELDNLSDFKENKSKEISEYQEESPKSKSNKKSSFNYKDDYDDISKSKAQKTNIKLSNDNLSIEYTYDEKSNAGVDAEANNKERSSPAYEDDFDNDNDKYDKSKDKSSSLSESIHISEIIDMSQRNVNKTKTKESIRNDKSYSYENKFDNNLNTKTEQSEYKYDDFDDISGVNKTESNITKSLIAKSNLNLTNRSDKRLKSVENNKEKYESSSNQINKFTYEVDKNANSQAEISGIEDTIGNLNSISINARKSIDKEKEKNNINNNQYILNYSKIDEGDASQEEKDNKSKTKSLSKSDKSNEVKGNDYVVLDNTTTKKEVAEKYIEKVNKITNRAAEHNEYIKKHKEVISDRKVVDNSTNTKGVENQNVAKAVNELNEHQKDNKERDNYLEQIYNNYKKTFSSSQTKFISSFVHLKRVSNEEIEYFGTNFSKKEISQMKLEHSLAEERKRKDILLIQSEKMKEQIADYEIQLKRMRRLEIENSELLKSKLESELKYSELEKELKEIIADYEQKYKLAEQRIVSREEKNETRKIAEIERVFKLEIHNLKNEIEDKLKENIALIQEKKLLEDQNSKLMIGQIAKYENDDRFKELQYENFLLYQRNNELLDKIERVISDKEKLERKHFEKEVLNKIDDESFIASNSITFSVVGLKDNKLFAIKNKKRPLWQYKTDKFTLIASTNDIMKRAGIDNAEQILNLKRYEFYRL